MIRILKSGFRRIAAAALSFFGIEVLSACGGVIETVSVAPVMYGMPPNFNSASGIVTGDIDGDGRAEPVEGIKVSVNEGGRVLDWQATNEVGGFSLKFNSYKDNFTLDFEDIDGAQNGSFKPKSVPLNLGDSRSKVVDAELERSGD